MVSFGASIHLFIMKTSMSISKKRNNNSFTEFLLKNREKTSEHKFKKGYKVTFKETEKKSRYLIIQKDTNEPIKKIIYYIHGGAYISCQLNLHYEYSYYLCNLRNDIAVAFLDYSLAPEFTYPTQINEAMDVWKELIKEYKPEDIIIGGDSAGGNCAMVLIQQLAKQQMAQPKAAFFFSPMTDYTLSGESVIKNYQKDIILSDPNEPVTKESLKKFKNSILFKYYLGDKGDKNDPTVSPLFGDFTVFPNSIFFVGTDEILLDDTLRVVDKIKKENKDCKVECIVEERMFHGYALSINNMIPEYKATQEKVKAFILENLQ